jgi:hypothetical protein
VVKIGPAARAATARAARANLRVMGRLHLAGGRFVPPM